MLRTSAAGDGFERARPGTVMLSPYQQAARGRIETAARDSPIRQPRSAAAQNPSSRSITPPWPGMSWLASFAPNWRLTQDSMRSPSCATTDSSNAMRAIAGRLNEPNKAGDQDRHDHGAERAGNGAGPGFFRAHRRPQFRPAEGAAGKISEHVGRPDHREQQHHRRNHERHRRAAASARATWNRHSRSRGNPQPPFRGAKIRAASAPKPTSKIAVTGRPSHATMAARQSHYRRPTTSDDGEGRDQRGPFP